MGLVIGVVFCTTTRLCPLGLSTTQLGNPHTFASSSALHRCKSAWIDQSSSGLANRAKPSGKAQGDFSDEPSVTQDAWMCHMTANKCGGCEPMGHSFRVKLARSDSALA